MGARVSRAAAVILLAIVAGPGLLRGGSGNPPTRDDFESERRRVAALESEMALASTRKPYLVLDLESKTLRYRLMGMTMREVPLPGLRAKGLVPASPGTQSTPPSLAGIFTVSEKDNDPRLNPLTPEQVEAGADDENVANVLPPEPPKSYRIKFKQPVVMRVTGHESGAGVRGGWAVLRALWDGLRGGGGKDGARLEFSVRLEAGTSAEVYRSLIPDLRWLVLPPRGFSLPQAGQEPPPKPKTARAAPKPLPKPIEPPGVPFQIPSPVEENGVQMKPSEPPQEEGTAPDAPPPGGPPESTPADPLPEDPGGGGEPD